VIPRVSRLAPKQGLDLKDLVPDSDEMTDEKANCPKGQDAKLQGLPSC
jgi:hypothetical protein